MEYRRLGRCGLQVSELCLGTMTFGRGADAAEAARMVDAAWAAGVNFFDTADTYGDGEAERLLGAALGPRRSHAVVATKFFNPTGSGPNDSGASRAHIVAALEQSLRRLRTDYVDLYYVHHVDEQTPLEETLRALDDLVHQGKVRYPACSNFEAWRLMEACWLARSLRLFAFACYQAQYSLVVRDIETELIPACQCRGLGVVAWSPLGGGFLAGKYRPGQTTVPGTRSAADWAFPRRYFSPAADQVLAALLEVAAASGHSPAQTALRWVLEQPQVSSAIVGARTAAQLEDDLQAADWRLAADARARLDAVSRLPARYPQSMEAQMRARRDGAVAFPPHASAAADR